MKTVHFNIDCYRELGERMEPEAIILDALTAFNNAGLSIKHVSIAVHEQESTMEEKSFL